MARIDSLPRSATEIRNIPERYWLKSDKDVRLVAFYPFRDFYGGYLIYEILNQVQNDTLRVQNDKNTDCTDNDTDYTDKGTDFTDKKTRRYKQFISNKMARKLGIKEVYVYGKRAS